VAIVSSFRDKSLLRAYPIGNSFGQTLSRNSVGHTSGRFHASAIVKLAVGMRLGGQRQTPEPNSLAFAMAFRFTAKMCRFTVDH